MGVSLWAVDSKIHRFIPLFVQQTGADQGLGHAVRVAVGGRAAVFEVPLLLLAHAAGNADAGTAVGHAGREFVDVGGLVVAGEAASVVQPAFGVVGTDMVTVPLAKLLDAVLDSPGNTTQKRNSIHCGNPPSNETRVVCRFSLQSTVFSHLFRAEVCVAAGPVPVSGDWLGVEWGNNAKIFTDPVQQEARHPQVITHVNPFARPDLELPLEDNKQLRPVFSSCNLVQVGSVCSSRYLSRHHFCIGAANLDSSIKTGSIVSLHNISTIGLISSNTAVVRACRDTQSKPWSQQVENQIGANSNTNRTWKPSVPCGPGKPLEGQPNGWPSVPRMVYSCSIPNQGCWSFTISITFLHEIRRLVSGGQIKINPVRWPSRNWLCCIVQCGTHFFFYPMCPRHLPIT